MKQYTDISVLLDRSGSMSNIKESMQTAFDNFIKEHKAVPSTRVTLVQFDDQNDQDVVYQAVPVEAVEKLSLRPRGNTPLLDAMCKLIDRTGQRFSSMDEVDRPDQVLVVIITDGQENASRSYRRADVSSRVTKQREGFKWQFVYLGANQDAIAEAQSFGIPAQWSLTYNANQIGTTSASASLASNTLGYVQNNAGSRGQHVNSFSASQRKQAIEQDPQDNSTGSFTPQSTSGKV